MRGNDDAHAELLRKFEAAIAGMEMADLRELTGNMSLFAGRAMPLPDRPELRRPPRDEAALYRVRVDLDHAKPPIWRRLGLRSDLLDLALAVGLDGHVDDEVETGGDRGHDEARRDVFPDNIQ